MKPSHKARSLRDIMDAIAQDMFGRSCTESIENDMCVECGGSAVDFKDQLSRKEYSISGLCQECQDKIWI